MSIGFLSDLERGECSAGPDSICRIAQALAVPIEAITREEAHHMSEDSELRLYTKHQVAELLGISVSWLTKRAAEKTIPCTYIGFGARRVLRFSAQNIRDLIASGDNDPATQGQQIRRRQRATAA